MFCYQCQEAAKGFGCTKIGVCGKTEKVSNLQDLLVYISKGVSVYAHIGRLNNLINKQADQFVFEALFMTITNANFDDSKIVEKIKQGISVRDTLKAELLKKGVDIPPNLPESALWSPKNDNSFVSKSLLVGILTTENEDVRSLKELLVYGLKGMAAYAEHAFNLGYENNEIMGFIHNALSQTTNDNLSVNEWVELVLQCGKYGVDVIALLDKANTESYCHTEI
jgi:hydroxylamine reductase